MTIESAQQREEEEAGRRWVKWVICVIREVEVVIVSVEAESNSEFGGQERESCQELGAAKAIQELVCMNQVPRQLGLSCFSLHFLSRSPQSASHFTGSLPATGTLFRLFSAVAEMYFSINLKFL